MRIIHRLVNRLALLGLLASSPLPGLADDIPNPALLVLHKGERAMAIVDPATGKVVGQVPSGPDPHELVVAADGKLAIASNYNGANTLSVIDIASRQPLRKVDLALLTRPHGLWVNEGKVYFTAEGSMAVGRYDPVADKVDLILGTGQDRTHMVVLTPDGKTIVTANVSSNTISIIERTMGRGPGGPPPGGPGGPRGMGGPPGGGPGWKQTVVTVGRGPEGFDLTPDGKQIWAAHSGDGWVSVIDVATKQVIRTIDAGAPGANRLKLTPDGKLALISQLGGGGGVVVLDTTEGTVKKRIKVGRGAAGILISPDGRRAFIALTGDNAIAVLDLVTLTELARWQTGTGPDGMAWLAKQP